MRLPGAIYDRNLVLGLFGAGVAARSGGIWTAPFVGSNLLKPFTILTWVRDTTGNNFAANAVYGGLSSGPSGSALGYAILQTSLGFYADENSDTGGEVFAGPLAMPAAPSAGWMPMIGVFNGPNSRIAYGPNGTSASDATALNAIETYNLVTLGDYYIPTTTTSLPCPTTQIMAEFAIWRCALGPAEITLLQSGASPLAVRRESLFCYFPLRNDLFDDGPLRMRLAGPVPVWGDHPMITPSRPLAQRYMLPSTALIASGSPTLIWLD